MREKKVVSWTTVGTTATVAPWVPRFWVKALGAIVNVAGPRPSSFLTVTGWLPPATGMPPLRGLKLLTQPVISVPPMQSVGPPLIGMSIRGPLFRNH
jgi:hypothetical protein